MRGCDAGVDLLRGQTLAEVAVIVLALTLAFIKTHLLGRAEQALHVDGVEIGLAGVLAERLVEGMCTVQPVLGARRAIETHPGKWIDQSRSDLG